MRDRPVVGSKSLLVFSDRTEGFRCVSSFGDVFQEGLSIGIGQLSQVGAKKCAEGLLLLGGENGEESTLNGLHFGRTGVHHSLALLRQDGANDVTVSRVRFTLDEALRLQGGHR